MAVVCRNWPAPRVDNCMALRTPSPPLFLHGALQLWRSYVHDGTKYNNVCRPLWLPIWPQTLLVVCPTTCGQLLTSVRLRQHLSQCPLAQQTLPKEVISDESKVPAFLYV